MPFLLVVSGGGSYVLAGLGLGIGSGSGSGAGAESSSGAGAGTGSGPDSPAPTFYGGGSLSGHVMTASALEVKVSVGRILCAMLFLLFI